METALQTSENKDVTTANICTCHDPTLSEQEWKELQILKEKLKSKKKKTNQKKSARAKITLSVARIRSKCKAGLEARGVKVKVRDDSMVYVAALVERFIMEIFANATEDMRRLGKVRVMPFYVARVVHGNPTFRSMLRIAPPEEYTENESRSKKSASRSQRERLKKERKNKELPENQPAQPIGSFNFTPQEDPLFPMRAKSQTLAPLSQPPSKPVSISMEDIQANTLAILHPPSRSSSNQGVEDAKDLAATVEESNAPKKRKRGGQGSGRKTASLAKKRKVKEVNPQDEEQEPEEEEDDYESQAEEALSDEELEEETVKRKRAKQKKKKSPPKKKTPKKPKKSKKNSGGNSSKKQKSAMKYDLMTPPSLLTLSPMDMNAAGEWMSNASDGPNFSMSMSSSSMDSMMNQPFPELNVS